MNNLTRAEKLVVKTFNRGPIIQVQLSNTYYPKVDILSIHTDGRVRSAILKKRPLNKITI
jgi:hypothetical protein